MDPPADTSTGQDASAFSEDQFLNLKIIDYTSNIHYVLAKANHSVLELKKFLLPKVDYPLKRLRLIFGNKILKDDKLLSDYGIITDSKITLIILADNQDSSASRSAPAKDSKPEDALLKLISKSPIMKEMMKSPEFIQQIFSSNPQFKEMIKKNPEFKTVFEDSSYMEQFFSAAQNPEVMKEMMRNNDRAISNLEMQPGGYKHLTQLYNNVQKPLETVGDTEEFHKQSKLSNEYLSKVLNIKQPPKNKINTEPLPNPWAPRPQYDPLSSMFNAQSSSSRRNPLQDPFSFDDYAHSSNPNKFLFGAKNNQNAFLPSRDVIENTRNMSKLKISNANTAKEIDFNYTNTVGSDVNMSTNIETSNSALKSDVNMLEGDSNENGGNSQKELSSTFNQAQELDSESINYESKIQMLVDMGFPNKDMNQSFGYTYICRLYLNHIRFLDQRIKFSWCHG
ncbi:hypothetical protein BB561_002879 [Smittium simulii]|uniref:Ubiquitin-like domain-containing protein n=1 Tax=Smittium simulii TaxID=133385 RepID=A0A2T9YNS3_9FUNG|nr:hypothetical protein BB561_002879 [Smittium simulii]